MSYLARMQIAYAMLQDFWQDKLAKLQETLEELFLCPGYFEGYSK